MPFGLVEASMFATFLMLLILIISYLLLLSLVGFAGRVIRPRDTGAGREIR
ncbi:hypothetical protein M2281_005602 [Mesorhizobium soli]|jgi:hypothetical protein|nr:hypothetical protein [Mesorhizobium soli]